MIKIQDIRIGNFILEEDGDLAKVIGMKPFDHSVRCDEEEGCELLVSVYHSSGVINEGYLSTSPKSKPIPITPAVLEACGFVQKTNYYESLQFGWLFLGDHKDGYLPLDNLTHMMIRGRIHYLHQLQNVIYYYTVGQAELQVDPIKLSVAVTGVYNEAGEVSGEDFEKLKKRES